jgi:excinuclease ABC subunit B
MSYKNPAELEHAIASKRKQMEKAAKDLDFIQAAKYRDELFELQAQKK